MNNFEYEIMVACGLRKEADAKLQHELSKNAAFVKALDDRDERNTWAFICECIAPPKSLNETPDKNTSSLIDTFQRLTPDPLIKIAETNLTFIMDMVSRLHSTESVRWRRRAYECGIFAIGNELDRRKLGTAAPPPAPAAASRRELAHAKEDAKNIDESVRAENGGFEKGNAAPVKADEAPSDMLTIYESAKYARVDVRTIRNWLKATTGNGPMLPGVLRSKHKIRIPRAALDLWKKSSKRLRKPTKSIKKRGRRKAVKRKR